MGSRAGEDFVQLLECQVAILAALFYVTSMVLAYYAAQVGEPQGLMEGVAVPAPAEGGAAAPATREEPKSEGPAEAPGAPAVPVPVGGGSETDVPSVPAAAQAGDASSGVTSAAEEPEVPAPVGEQPAEGK